MEDFGAFLLFIFIVLRVLSGLRGGGQQTRPRPPGRAGGGPQTSQRPPERSAPGADAEPQTAAPTSAADMIPDELWELLTGEKRRPAPASTPQPPVPAPTQAGRLEWSPVPEGADVDEEEWEEEWEPELPPSRAPRPAVSLEVEPVIRSLEELELSPEERHAAFHAKVAAPPVPAPRPRRGRPIRLKLGDRDEMRRMMILREVLGPPKALE